MFAKASYMVLYLKRSTLEFYDTKTGENRIFEFSQQVVKDKQIKNKEAFITLLTQFVAKSGYKKRKALLILSKDVIEEKETDTEDEKSVAELLKDIPGEPDEVVYKTLKAGNDVYVIAVNQDLYETIAHVFKDLGWDLHLVVPVTLFVGSDKKEAFSREEIKKIIDNISLLKVGNLLNSKPKKVSELSGKQSLIEEEIKETPVKTKKESYEEDKVKEKKEDEQKEEVKEPVIIPEESHSHKKMIIISVLSIFFVIFIFTFLLVRAGYFNLPTSVSMPFTQPSPTPTATPTPSPLPPTPTPVPQKDKIDKEGMVVQIFNGTGTPGQAGEVKSALSKLGFGTINTGNSDTTDEVNTTVVFSGKVGAVTRKEVTDQLEKMFETVVSEEDLRADFDVKITTGKEITNP